MGKGGWEDEWDDNEQESYTWIDRTDELTDE